MARSGWEEVLRRWSKPSSDAEELRCVHAERMIRDAISASSSLRGRQLKVFAQGSYHNNTNVRTDSDVDIVVCCYNTFYFEFDPDTGLTRDSAGFVPATYAFADFRNDVERALVAKFGTAGVTRGNKAFDVHENGYRVDADVVSCFEYRRYTHVDDLGIPQYESGTTFIADDGSRTVNWPDHHHRRGVAKNTATGNRFKFMVRALKRLRAHMDENGVAAARGIPSFLIECIVYNVPDKYFGHPEYVDDMRAILAVACLATDDDESCKAWTEVNRMKWLFRSTQPWTRQQAHGFLSAAWGYLGSE